MPTSQRDLVRALLVRAAAALDAAGVPYALCGGYAAWVRGAPEPEHDADLVVPAAAAGRAVGALRDAGLALQQAPEGWLVKVVAEDAFVDVLWQLGGEPVAADRLDGAERLTVLGAGMPVLSATDVLVTKLSALDEHYCDLSGLLPVARALADQVDWGRVRCAVAGSPFAEAALLLLDRLGVAPQG